MCRNYLYRILFQINYIYVNYAQFILDHLNSNETNSLTKSAKQLFSCKSNVIPNDKCVDSISKKIYVNKEFGICFDIFDKNRSIYLKHKDFVEINIEYESQRNILRLISPEERTLEVIVNVFYFTT